MTFQHLKPETINKIAQKLDIKLDGDDYICRHKLYPITIGAGDSPEEAERIFFELLDDAWEDIQTGNVVNKGGRPRKNNVPMHLNIDSDIKKSIEFLSKKKKMNYGKLVEEMTHFYLQNHPDL